METTYEWLVKRYGKPILRFYPHGTFTIQEKVEVPIPFECAIFKINKTYEFITCCRYSNYNNWHLAEGDKFAVRELLRRLSI